MNARWIKQAVQYHGLPVGPAGITQQEQWIAVADDDEVLGFVTEAAPNWTAVCGSGAMNQKIAVFVSEQGAKSRLESWLAPKYTFPKASDSTAWTTTVYP